MTVRDLISASLRDLGVLASGESLQPADGQDALLTLNNLLDSWSTNSLFVYDRVNRIFTLATSKQTYTLGTGGDFNAPRPIFIEKANWVDPAQNPTYELTLQIFTMEQWAEIMVKGLQGTIPWALYYDKAFPLMNVNFWPIPISGKEISLWNWETITSFSSLNDTITLPPGYNRAIQKNLALELAPSYSRQVSPELASSAQVSMADIKRANVREKLMKVDDALTHQMRPFSIYTGWPRS
jgi:hypothetical protein